MGMIRLMTEEVREALSSLPEEGTEEWRQLNKEEEISIATGLLPYPYIKEYTEQITARFKGKKVHVYGIRNDFSESLLRWQGLSHARDLIAQLKGKALGSRLLLPESHVQKRRGGILG